MRYKPLIIGALAILALFLSFDYGKKTQREKSQRELDALVADLNKERQAWGVIISNVTALSAKQATEFRQELAGQDKRYTDAVRKFASEYNSVNKVCKGGLSSRAIELIIEAEVK